MSTRKYSTLASIGAVVGLLTTALVGTGAQAAEHMLGNVTCSYGAEIHSVSNSKGDIRHEIYGAWQVGAMWPVTSSISPGYSSTYSSWDVHHWMFHKNESGGRAKGEQCHQLVESAVSVSGPCVRRLALIGLVAAPLVLGVVGCSTESPGDRASVSELRNKYPTQLDLAKARATCLNDRGWGVKVNDSAQIEATYPSNRQAAYEQDDRECLLDLGIDPEAPTPEHLVEAAYPQYEEGAACPIAAGWPISSTPSLQRFEETYESQRWYPWSEVPLEDLTKALKECPTPEATY